jgi:preprotein translocase subunit Sec63
MITFAPANRNEPMRPFKVLGIQQIAVGNEDKNRLEKFWVDLMGLEKTGSFKSERENVDEDILRIGKGAYGKVTQGARAETEPYWLMDR